MPPTETGGGRVLGEGDDVVPARSLSVDESISAPVLAQTEDLFVEPQRASQIPDGEIDVSKAVGLNHCYLEIVSPPNARHAGPNDVNREAELRRPSRVACSAWPT